MLLNKSGRTELNFQFVSGFCYATRRPDRLFSACSSHQNNLNFIFHNTTNTKYFYYKQQQTDAV